jgi:uncharacterized membrane protein (DUF485 family)
MEMRLEGPGSLARNHAQTAAIGQLIAAKVRLLVPMIVIYMAGYVGVTALAGFAKGFMALKVIGSLNLGFVLIGLNYVLSWALALIYVRAANTVFDPMVERAVVETDDVRARP